MSFLWYKAVFVCWLFSTTFFGQNVDFVSDLKLNEVNQQILVSWTIDSGQTCQGINVLHSLDGINFSEVGHISGICGSLTKAEDYTFLHESSIPNEVNYYRIELGGFGYSDIVSIFIIAVASGDCVIYPNPVIGSSFTLKYQALTTSDVQIKIFDSKGKLMYFHEYVGNSAEVSLDQFSLTHGIYFVEVLEIESGTKSSGKFMVL